MAVAFATARLAERLREQRAAILATWRAKVLSDPRTPEARRLPLPALDDHVPLLVTELARALDACEDDLGRAEALGYGLVNEELARAHARDRARHGYSLRAALREVAILRMTLADACAALDVREGHAASVLLGISLDEVTAHLGTELMDASEAQALQDARIAREAALLSDVGIAMTGTDDLRGLLQQCAEATVTRLGAAFARIWTLGDDQDVLVLQASAGMYTRCDGAHGRIPLGSLKIGRIASTRRPHLTNDVQHDPEIGDPAWAAREGMVAFAGYPLLVGDRLVGVLALFARQALADDTLTALGTVATSIALGVDRWHTRDVLDRTRHDLATTLKSIGDAVISTDAQGRVAFMNAVAVEITRWSVADARGKPIGEVLALVDEQARSSRPSSVDAVLRRNEASDAAVPTLLRRRDGTEVPIEDSAAPIRNEQGELTGVVLVFRDVSARREAEAERARLFGKLSESEARTRLVLEASALGTWSLELDRGEKGALLADGHFRELFGLTASEPFSLERELSLIHPEDRPRVALAVEEAIAGADGGAYHAEYRTVQLADGGHRWVEARGQRLLDDSGAPSRLLGTGLDITDRKRRAEENERTVRQRAEVLEAIGDAFFALDRQWRFVLVNHHYERLARKDRDQTLGRVFWELFPDAARPESKYFTSFHRAMDERVDVQFVDYYPSLDLWTDVRVHPTEGGISVFFRDVSSERRASDTRERQSELEQQLLGIVSHDLRNPLNAIAMGAQVLSLRQDLDPGARETVVRIQNATGRATRLISDLLDFTQARLGGGIRVVKRAADLREITRTVLDEIDAAHPDRVVQLRASGETSGSWDPDRMAQVVQNLVTNAIKHGHASTPVRVEIEGQDRHVMLRVHNEGPPIPQGRLAHVFEPLQRGTDAIDTRTRSVGLGLYIVRSIVRAHGGTIVVVSTEGTGTTFAARLPRA